MTFKARGPRIWKYSNHYALVSALAQARVGDILLPQHPIARGTMFSSAMQIAKVPDLYRDEENRQVIANGHFVGLEEVWA
jgi:hypothetical protein